MKKEQLKEFDNSILENIETACLETDKEGRALLLAYAQGYAAAKKKYHKDNKADEKKEDIK